MKVKSLVRPEVLALKPYVPAKKVKNKIRLNANESPYTVTEFAALNKLNLYPNARPDEIKNKMLHNKKIRHVNFFIVTLKNFFGVCDGKSKY